MSERETTRWSGEQKPPGLTPADMKRLMRETTILQAGEQDGIHWAQVTTPGGTECWVALDFDAYRGALLPYAEALQVTFVYEWEEQRPLTLWRFDYVSKRPPQVTWTATRGIRERDPRLGTVEPSLPETIEVLFDVLEIEIV